MNRDGGGSLSPETAELLDTALGMCRRTNGALDISIYPVLRAWGFTTGEYAIPAEAELAALLPLVDYTQVRQDGTYASLPDGMEIDLGSVAKGYTGAPLPTVSRSEWLESGVVCITALLLTGTPSITNEVPIAEVI